MGGMNDKNSSPQPRVLVTGGARRIGATLVKTLHDMGMQTAIHCRASREDAEQLCGRLNRIRPASASVHQGDLGDDSTPATLIDEVVAHHGGLDVLINNASSFFPTPVAATTVADWEDLLVTNLKAPFFLSQAAAPHLAKNNGLIINIADIHGIRPMRGYAVYSIAKAGLLMMTKTLALELGPRVRVNAIAPGAIIWPEEQVVESTDRERIVEQTPLGTKGSPQDIAGTVSFLIRDAGFITGQTIAVDGGRTAVQT